MASFNKNAVKILSKIVESDNKVVLYTEFDGMFEIGDKLYIMVSDQNSIEYQALDSFSNSGFTTTYIGYTLLDKQNNQLKLDIRYDMFLLSGSSINTNSNVFIGRVYIKNGIIDSNTTSISINGTMMYDMKILPINNTIVNWNQGIINKSTSYPIKFVTFNKKYDEDTLILYTTIKNNTVSYYYTKNNHNYGLSYINLLDTVSLKLDCCDMVEGIFQNCRIYNDVNSVSHGISGGTFLSTVNANLIGSGTTIQNKYIIYNGNFYNVSIYDFNVYFGNVLEYHESVTWYNGTWYNDWVYSISKLNNPFKCDVWYNGTWKYGIFPSTTVWNNGRFLNGDISNTTWNNGQFNSGTSSGLIWNNGIFNDGHLNNCTWNNGTFNNGLISNSNWYNGIFNNGNISNSTWYNGTFNNGVFNNSTWYDGIFNDGTFSNSYWYDGTFYNDEFINSTWYNGIFYNGKLTNSIWYYGKFYKGTITNSTWYDGELFYGIINGLNWTGGTWHNGIANNLIWSAGTWEQGIFNYGVFFYGDWLNGSFNGGIFGIEDEFINPAIWHSGNFYTGEFYGYWISGTFYTGIYNNIPSTSVINSPFLQYFDVGLFKLVNNAKKRLPKMKLF